MWINTSIFQFIVSGHLGGDGPLALGPVDMELELKIGEGSKMQEMVADNVMEVVGPKVHVA